MNATEILPEGTEVEITDGGNAGRTGVILANRALHASCRRLGYVIDIGGPFGLAEVAYGAAKRSVASTAAPAETPGTKDPAKRAAPYGAPGYDSTALAAMREIYGDVPWLVHVAGTEEVLVHADDGPECNGLVPHTRQSAFAAACAINATIAHLHRQLDALEDYRPLAHATVFHHGVPKPAPVELGDTVKVTEPGPHAGHTGTVGGFDPGTQPERPFLVEIAGTDCWMPEHGIETLAGRPEALAA